MNDILGMDRYEAVLRFIDLALENRGWNRTKLAKEMGMSKGWISKIMSGDVKLSVPRLLQIAEKLMVPPASLLPIIEAPGQEGAEPMTFEDYCRKIVQPIIQQEVEKALSKK